MGGIVSPRLTGHNDLATAAKLSGGADSPAWVGLIQLLGFLTIEEPAGVLECRVHPKLRQR
ncbi:hypothetical protein AYO44_01025 [Planctomycetaceae bacterium SCGC AG-212-F19]|nr:hypothetical protein AYO44_01025 [Planctomycetaceae bacterium SCGC AG-212-F19]